MEREERKVIRKHVFFNFTNIMFNNSGCRQIIIFVAQYLQRGNTRQQCLLTTFVALPLLDLQCQVKGADREVDSLGVHSSHLADKRGSQITFQRLPLRNAKERRREKEREGRQTEVEVEGEWDRETAFVC